MNPQNNTIPLTGGASGIGLALAQRFRAAGSEVIIRGRRADKLREAQAAGEQEVGYGTSEKIRQASRAELEARFEQMNSH